MTNRLLSVLLAAMLWLSASATAATNNAGTTIPLLRLKLSLDALNSDDIAIGFLSTASTQYNANFDSRYLPGINAPEGLACLSSDNVLMSSYVTPLPTQGQFNIRLDVEAAASGSYTLQRTELDSIAAIYDVWLVDAYAKDSINLRTSTDYAFSINKSDTSSFGINRFRVVIRGNPLLSLRLLNFDALKDANDANVMWTTENEQNNTLFAVERSIDGGTTFFTLDTLTSTSTGYYTYTDKTPISGTDLYRLKIADVNGTVTYSNEVTLSFGGNTTTTITSTQTALNVYPNPSSGEINLAINEETASAGSVLPSQMSAAGVRSYSPVNTPGATTYAIKIFSIKGMVMRSATSSATTWQDNLGNLLPGTYIVEVTNKTNNRVVGKSTFIKL